MKRKIFDCFIFFNEFDLLEIRLTELYDHVDYFVMAEANTTHTGNPKPFYFLDNKERYKPFLDKIIHIKVEDMPGPQNGDNMPNDRHQRNCLVRGLGNAASHDVIMCSDVDELLRPHCPDFIRYDFLHNYWAFRVPMFNYRFNYMWIKPLMFQVNGQAYTVEWAKKFPNINYIRETHGGIWTSRTKMYDDRVDMCFPHAGWHFSSMGNSNDVITKFISGAGHESYDLSKVDVDSLIKQGKSMLWGDRSGFMPVKLDDYFPKTILQNKEKYKHLILEGATESALEKLSIISMNSNQEYSY